MGPESVGIAIGYGLKVPGIKSRWGRDFGHLSRPTLEPTQLPIQWVLNLFRGNKAAGSWGLTAHPIRGDVIERVDLTSNHPLDVHSKGQGELNPDLRFNPYPTAFPYGNGMVLHFYQQQESSTTKTVHKVINKGLKTYV